MMDTNNFSQKIGVGEREVQQRNYYLAHGIGRSGDITGNQPKAAGSSLILQLTKYLLLDALKILNYQFIQDLLILPMATGMALSHTFLTLKQMSPKKSKIVFLRIDQKTCLKSIVFACCEPIIIHGIIQDNTVKSNLEQLEQVLQNDQEVKEILAVLSTTSCFAPRSSDDVENISILCKKYNVSHIINNAYGVMNGNVTNQINLAHKKGRVDAVIQSTDKNFLVPVGGSIVFSNDKTIIQKISQIYPGRASISPIMDIFITLLEMGRDELLKLYKERKENYKYLLERINNFAKENNEQVLSSNGVSIALSLKNINSQDFQDKNNQTSLGSILYTKRVMGCRVVSQQQNLKKIVGFEFKNYGSHHDNYPSLPYLTVACAIGMQKYEIDIFYEKLQQAYKKKQSQEEQ